MQRVLNLKNHAIGIGLNVQNLKHTTRQFHGLNNAERPTNGLASCGVSARGKFCGNLKVSCPSEHLRSPARTPSRQPLAATLHDSKSQEKLSEKSLTDCPLEAR